MVLSKTIKFSPLFISWHIYQSNPKKNIVPKIYQVADDEALSTNELIQIMADSQNKKASIWRVPVGFIKALVRTGDFLHLPLNSERLKNSPNHMWFPTKSLKRHWGSKRCRLRQKKD